MADLKRDNCKIHVWQVRAECAVTALKRGNAPHLPCAFILSCTVCVCGWVYVCMGCLACKHDISKSLCVMYVICGIVIAHGLKMCPIVFGSDVMHINEGAGLNVKILKCSYILHNHKSVWFLNFHIKLGYVVN